MSTGSLVFRPPPGPVPETASLEARLREAGFIGAPLGGEINGFLTGERFLQRVSFLGCSPFLRLEPPADGSDRFCHVRFLGPYPAIRLLHGTNTRPPPCPGCGQRIGNWHEALAATGGEIDCPHCGRHATLTELDWQRNAGAGRFFVEVREVFPGEAVPLPGLMELLRGAGGAWDYFYLTR